MFLCQAEYDHSFSMAGICEMLVVVLIIKRPLVQLDTRGPETQGFCLRQSRIYNHHLAVV